MDEKPSDALNLVRFPKGTVIVREGAMDQDAFIIASGTAEVYRGSGASRTILARLGEGQIFGEMALILERPRTASVRAVDDVEAWKIDPATFAYSLEAAKPILPVIRLIFERLRTVASPALHGAGLIVRPPASGEPRTLDKDFQRVGLKTVPVLAGLTPEARATLDVEGVGITKIPYRIGRSVPDIRANSLSNNDLYITDRDPFQVSRNHCSINHLAQEDVYIVQDRGSTLGTIVNGKSIGLRNPVNVAPLDRQDNELILGNGDSVYRYRITLRTLV